MTKIGEISHLEQEFEELVESINQHFSSLEKVDQIRKQIQALNQFRAATEDNRRQTHAILGRIEETQQLLKQRNDELEISIKTLNEGLVRLQHKTNEIAGHVTEWPRQRKALETKVMELESRLNQLVEGEITKLEKESRLVTEHIRELDIWYKSLYGTVKGMGKQMRSSYKNLIIGGSLGLVLLSLLIPYIVLNQ
jgi:chromosome segregation ATPase